MMARAKTRLLGPMRRRQRKKSYRKASVESLGGAETMLRKSLMGCFMAEHKELLLAVARFGP